MNIFERIYPFVILLTALYVTFILPPLLKPWWGIRRPPNHKNSRWFT